MLDKTKWILYILVFLSPAALLCAQGIHSDSIYQVEGVVITSNRLSTFTSGSKIETIDSNVLNQNSNNTLADLLTQQTQVFVKSYGIAGLSTPSFRGTNANQTAILWNGFNLSSPMNGGLDLALIPVNFANNISLQFGGAGALWGSGAIGGTIHLNNKPEFNTGFTANTSLSYGSFDDYQQNFTIGISKKKFISTTKIFHHQAANNFPFINIAQSGKPKEFLQNAAIDQSGVLQENYFKLNKHQNISFRLWYQNNNRNIPASMTSKISEITQNDEALRSTIEWQRIKVKSSYFVRAAYFDETLNYKDPQINLVSNSRTKRIISEAETKIKLAKGQVLNIGINNTYSTALSINFNKTPTQNRTALFGSYQLKNSKSTFKTTASIRQEFVSNGLHPFTASLGFEAWPHHNIRTRATISKNYRIPTFNDLYWAQGGNPNLLPEYGYGEEAGIAYILCKNKIGIEYEFTALNNQIKNWILWTPNNVGIWTPENVARVWSYGIENDLKIFYTIHKSQVYLKLHYQCIKTINTKIDGSDQSALNKQLIYTPVYKTSSSIGIQRNNFNASLIYNYIDYRYTTSDNSQFLDPYFTLDINVGKTFERSNLKFKIYFQANNITNESYQIIAYYPTPGRSFQVGLVVNFNKKNKQTP